LSQDHHYDALGVVRSSVQSVTELAGQRTVPTSAWEAPLDIAALNGLALRSLDSLFEPKENLFLRSITPVSDDVSQPNTSRRRTIVALLGLHRLAESGWVPSFDLESIQDTLLMDTNWVRGVGDLGILTWFTAVLAPQRLQGLFNEFDFTTAIETHSDARQARTTALASFLAGIAHAHLASTDRRRDLTDLAVDTYRLLLENQAQSGLFGQAAFAGMLRQAYSRRFGTFNDQICAIYALSAFAKSFDVEEPLAAALSCANAICELQGDEGEWWFLYDTRTGRVANRYPLFTWQQDGTAPVGLQALAEVTGQCFHEHTYKGLAWIAGSNAIETDLRDEHRGLIWDSMRVSGRIASCWETARSLVNARLKPSEDEVSVCYEARPDHYGWLLYAFGKLGLPETKIGDKLASGNSNVMQ
jgi:hypothetical protein